MSFRLSPGCDCCEEVDYCIRPNINWPGWTPTGSWTTISECCWERDFIQTPSPSVVSIDSDVVYSWEQEVEVYHRTFASVGERSGSNCINKVADTTVGESWCKSIRNWKRKVRVKVTQPTAARLTVYLSFYGGVPYYNVRALAVVTLQSFPLVSELTWRDYRYLDGPCHTGRRETDAAPIAKSSYDAVPSQPAYTEGSSIAVITPVTLIAFGRVAATSLSNSYTPVNFSSNDADLPTSDATPCYNGVQQDYTYSYSFGTITPVNPSIATSTCALNGSTQLATAGFGVGLCYLPALRRFDNGVVAGSVSYLTLNDGCCTDIDTWCTSDATTVRYQREAEILSETQSTSSTTAVIDVDFATTVEIALWP